MNIFKNLRDLVLNNKIIFTLLIICIITSTLVIQFSYGIYQNYHVIIEYGESEYKQIDIEFDNSVDDYVKLEQLLSCINEFSPNLYKNIDFCTVLHDESTYRNTYKNMELVIDENETIINDPSKEISCYFSFDEKGNLIDSTTIRNNYMKSDFLEGRWFRKKELENKENVCIIGLGNGIKRNTPYNEKGKLVYYISHDGITEKDVFTDEFGDEYRIIGNTAIGVTIMPINVINKEYRIDTVYFELFLPITYDQYSELSTLLETGLGDYVDMPDLEFTDSKNTYLYKTILIICCLVSLAAGLNFIILFQYIMIRRKKKLAIFRICGCTGSKCIILCLSECLTITIPLYILSTFIYDRFIVSAFSSIYPYMKDAKSIKIYIILGTIYIGITTLITLIMLIKNITKVSIISLQKGRI